MTELSELAECNTTETVNSKRYVMNGGHSE